ncbi:MAG: hypothetical protein L0L18_09635, partial [Acidipropionibacterium jensenii]|nr:hypothetical protein [Acidipropionibacterium jensenii]
MAPGDSFIVLGAETVSARLTLGDSLHAEVVRISVPELALEAPAPVETGTVVLGARVQMAAPVLAFAGKTLQMDLEETSSLSIYYLERLLQEMVIGILVDHARSRVIPALHERGCSAGLNPPASS